MQHPEAIELRQHQIENQQLGLPASGQLQATAAVARVRGLKLGADDVTKLFGLLELLARVAWLTAFP